MNIYPKQSPAITMPSCLIIAIISVLASCNTKQKHVPEAEVRLNTYYNMMQEHDMSNVDTLAIDSIIDYYDENANCREIGICRLVRGTILYDRLLYNAAVREFKQAEHLLDETDTVCAQLYKNMAEILYVTNPDESRHYVQMLHNLATFYADTTAEIEANIVGIGLTESYEEAYAMRTENLGLCYATFDTLAMLRTNAKFAYTFADYIDTDSVLSLILPYYSVTKSSHDAELMAAVLLAANRPEEARPYIEATKDNASMQQSYLSNMAQYYYITDSCRQAMQLLHNSFVYFVDQYNGAYDENIARINAWHNRVEVEQNMQQQRIALSRRIVLIKTLTFCLVAAIIFVIYYLFIQRPKTQKQLQEAREDKQKTHEAKQQIEKDKGELEDKYYIQTHKLLAMTDICKQSLRIAAGSDIKVSEQTAMILKEHLHNIYPSLTETDWQYMFLAYIGMDKADAAILLGVNIKTINWRISQLRNKLNLPPRTKLNAILDEIFFAENKNQQA